MLQQCSFHMVLRFLSVATLELQPMKRHHLHGEADKVSGGVCILGQELALTCG